DYALECDGHRKDLHSFPPRRSSDLATDLAGGDLGSQRDGARRTGLGDSPVHAGGGAEHTLTGDKRLRPVIVRSSSAVRFWHAHRSEEHTSELQSRENLVCSLQLEKK